MRNQLDLDLDLLRAFVTVAETGSFTRAAHRLGRVQSAVSMQIKRLESLVGGQLFERRRGAVVLSGQGEVLLAHARRMLALNEEALADLGRAAIEGGVRLGSADTASVFLPGILARFAQSYPRAQLEVRCDRSWHILDALEAGDLDLALATQCCGRSGGEVVRREPLVWVTAAPHLAEEAALPLALFAQGCDYREAAMQALDGAGRRWRMAYNSTSVHGVRAAVAAGVAVAALPRSTVERGMHLLGPEDGLPPLPDYEIFLHLPPGRAAALIAHLAEIIREDLGMAVGGHAGRPRALAL